MSENCCPGTGSAPRSGAGEHQLSEARTPELDRFALGENETVIRSLDLGDQLHEGQLAGTVLTDNDVHLAGSVPSG
jgi:hypothetical protein